MASELVELIAGDAVEAWARLGFAVSSGRCRVGSVDVVLDGAGGGLRSWVLRGNGGPALVDGLATEWTADPARARSAVGGHPNGAVALDHVVVFTDSRDRTAAAMVAVGGDERRRSDPPAVPLPMAFVRFGSSVIEVAQTPEGPARFWGLVAVVEDFDGFVARYGSLLGPPRDAVQPGRRIVTVRREAGLGVALAFMTPR